MSTEPSYLPLLRRIANAECNAEAYLSAWAGATPRDDVRQVIATVALREGEHTKAFQKRICELGFQVAINPNWDDFVRWERDYELRARPIGGTLPAVAPSAHWGE